MNWKDHCKGFAIQNRALGCDWEGKALAVVGSYHKIPFKLVSKPEDVPEGWVPSGSVKWISEVLGTDVKPDYFPTFLKEFVTRKVWQEDKWPLKKVFIKPADVHKRFTGFVTSGTYKKKKRGPYWCSEIVSFVDEWRYYVAYGKVIGGYWYFGNTDEEKPAPEIKVDYPIDWCGTADFGRLADGRIELIESHPPFACGWYGKNHEEYAEFLTLGWKWLCENYKK